MLTTSPTTTDVASRLRLVVARTAPRLRQGGGGGPVGGPPAPADRRSSLISASAEGRALLRRQRSRKDQFLARRLAALSPDEVAALERAAAILERVLGEGGRR